MGSGREGTTLRSLRRLLALLAGSLVLGTGMQVAVAAPNVGYALLPGSVSPLVRQHQANAVGSVPGSQLVRFLVGLAPQDPGGLMTAARTDARQHIVRSAEEIAAQYGATPSEVQAVTQYFTSHGFLALGAEPDGLAVSFEGTAQLVDATFQTTLERYRWNGHTGFAPSSGLMIPASLQGTVTGVLGLDSLLQPVNMLARTGNCKLSGALALNHTALEMQTAYHVTPLFQNGFTGQGETIGIATWAEYDPSDVATFDQQMGLPSNQMVGDAPYQVIDAGRYAQYVGLQDGSDETSVDMEWSHAFAPGAQQEVAVGDLIDQPSFTQSLYDVFSALAGGTNSLTTPNVISTSWGYPEFYAPPETNQMLDELFAAIAAQGITVFVAAGDGDVSGWNVLYPASDPYVVAVGGTELQLNPDGTLASETAWGQPPFDQFYTASTGGYSTQFAAPPWALLAQEAYQPSSFIAPSAPYLPGMRGVPDVSLNAVGYLGAWQGGWYGFLGTSLGAPSWAGIFADMDQMATVKTGSGFGFVAPAMYAVAAGANSPFHDITQGNNGQFYAAPGWDPVTGLGTPDVAALAQDLVSQSGQGAGAPTAFVSAVTASAADGSNQWLGLSDPLVYSSVLGTNLPLTDALVAGTYGQISGSGFGTTEGAVYLENADGSIDISLPIASWDANRIVVDTTGAIAASPGLYTLVVAVPSEDGQTLDLPFGVALESGITLGNLGFALDPVSPPLSVDNYWVEGNVYANGLLSAVASALGALDESAAMPAALFIPGLATPEQPNAEPGNLQDQLLVTLSSPHAEVSGFTLNPLMVNPLPLYGLNAFGEPEYMVPAGMPLAVIDPVAEAVDVVVQDASTPMMVAPAQAEIDFYPGAPVTAAVGYSQTVQSATYDPSQAAPIQLSMVDVNSNVVPGEGSSWSILIDPETSVSASVYYQPQGGTAWVPAQTVQQGVYYVPQAGPTTIAFTDPQVGDQIQAIAFAGNVTPAAWPSLSDLPADGALLPVIAVAAQQNLILQPASVAPPSAGMPQLVEMAVYDAGGNVVSGASDTIALSPPAGVSILDQHGDPIMPGPDGSYTVQLQDGQASFYYVTAAAGPIDISASDESVLLPQADLQATVLAGPAQSLALQVFSSASVGNGGLGEQPVQMVLAGALDGYGNLATGFQDNLGLRVQGSGITVTDGQGNSITPNAQGLYVQEAQDGQAIFHVQSMSPGAVRYTLEDLGSSGLAPATATGDFLSPYAAALYLTASGSVAANGSVWTGVPQTVTVYAQDALGNQVTSNQDTVALAVYGPSGSAIRVQDPSGQALQPDAQGDYELQIKGGKAVFLVTSSLAGAISYSAIDLSVPGVSSTTLQTSVSTWPVTFSPLPVTITDAMGQGVSSSGGVLQLHQGQQYYITLDFSDNAQAMTMLPIVEVIGQGGTVAFLQGVKANLQDGRSTWQFSGFTPASSGSYAIKAFVWSNWLEAGGTPVAQPISLTVQAQ